MHPITSRLVAFCFVGCLLASPMVHGQKTAQLVPDTTKAYLVVPDANVLTQQFNKTEFGDLAKDPAIKPFADDLGKQLEAKLTEIDTRLGITWSDLKAVAAGEMALAVIQPQNNPTKHAVVAMADANGKGVAVKQLQAKVAAEMAKRGAKAQQITLGQIPVTKYTIPPAKGEIKSSVAYNCTVHGWIFAADNEEELQGLLARWTNPGVGALSNVAAFTTIMPLVSTKENANPEVQWFVEPFGYAATLRASNNKKRKGKDVAQILKQQGFDAIQGIGGAINFRKENAQVVHRSFVLATPGPKSPKLMGGAKVLQLPPHADNTPPDWVPEDVATTLVINWKINEAFDVLGLLFNAFQGQGFWEELLDGLEKERKGPRINLKLNLIQHLGERGLVITRPHTPIDVDSEHRILAMESNNPQLLERNLYPALDRDPTFKKIDNLDLDVIVWRHTPRDEKQRRRRPGEAPNPFQKPAPQGAPNAPRALAIKHGFLMYSTSEDFLIEVLRGGFKPLNAHADMKKVNQELADLGAGVDSLRYFTRLDRSQLVNYTLMKQGRMPKSKTLLGQLLNKIFEPEEPGVVRKQEINAAQLPEFGVVAKYLGLGGVYARELSNGWEITGAFLRKAPPANLGRRIGA